jgi:hypothetical protein
VNEALAVEVGDCGWMLGKPSGDRELAAKPPQEGEVFALGGGVELDGAGEQLRVG